MTLRLILGNQLFPIKYYKEDSNIFMCEDISLCTHFKYHKHKIIFFLASMRHYRDELEKKKKSVHYFEMHKKEQFFSTLLKTIKKLKINKIKIYEVADHFFLTKIEDFCEKNKIELIVEQSPMFMVSKDAFREYLKGVKKPFMKTFYEHNRKVFDVLMEEDGNPVGGKYSYDSENRNKIPKNEKVITNAIKNIKDDHVDDVKVVVDDLFGDHPGDCENYWIPVDRKTALAWFNKFIEERFELFGVYQDAIDTRDPFLYHSLLSPFINIGFITPKEVIEKVKDVDVPLNAKEGFIRQVLGWREFVRGIYDNFDDTQQKSNFFKHKGKLTKDWYDGTTGIPPLDDSIKKAKEFGYGHHIERLMIISNIMLMCEIDPQEVYKWFMEMYVDSSDWVMGPNVFGMGQFSDGGLFATKPYISGSNYIRKMSHYPKGDWCDTVDGLYWLFIDRRKNFFKKQYRMSMMISALEKMDEEKKDRIFKAAKLFIKEKTN